MLLRIVFLALGLFSIGSGYMNPDQPWSSVIPVISIADARYIQSQLIP